MTRNVGNGWVISVSRQLRVRGSPPCQYFWKPSRRCGCGFITQQPYDNLNLNSPLIPKY